MDQNSLFFQAMVYLGAAVLFVPVAKKLGLGSVLGYLLAGVVIGPAMLGFIGEEGQDLMHFAEFGVVMMLFLIGLELEPTLLWRLRASILGLGGLQVLLSTLIIGSISLLLFSRTWQESLALGMILSLSSTAIVLQILNEKGLMKTQAGQSSFSVLLFQDIAVIPMLAFIPLLVTYTVVAGPDDHSSASFVESFPGWARALIVFGAVAAIIIGGRFLVRPLFRMVAATRLRELFTASALLLVVGIAVLMTQVGLSPALGTFIAGVVLADSEFKHELESDIEPFKGLLLGLFFIAVGASLDFNLLSEQPWLVAGLVLLLMFVKAVILFCLGYFFKVRKDQNILFAFALSQIGEFAFVLFSFCMQEGVLPKQVVDLMMAVVAISMALTPMIMLLHEKVIQPKFSDCYTGENERAPDDIDERNPVIIAGFGHFGNTIGRFLRAHGIGTTILDFDADQVDLLRKLGFKVYYGDASRYDMLHAAGASQAKIIIIAIEPREKRMEMIETIKKHFPDLRMMVRAENRDEAYEQMNAGMLHVYRETIDTSIRIGVDTMKMLGFRSYMAQRAARTFFKYDEANLKKLAAIRNREEYLATARTSIEELDQILRSDRDAEVDLKIDMGWDEDGLRKEATA